MEEYNAYLRAQTVMETLLQAHTCKTNDLETARYFHMKYAREKMADLIKLMDAIPETRANAA